MKNYLAVLIIAFVLSLCGKSYCREKSPPIPAAELDHAREYLLHWFGDEVFEASLKYNSSGIIGSEETVDGYYVCYLFRPRSDAATGEYALICVNRMGDEEFGLLEGGDLPNCADDPGLCDVAVRNTAAIQVAQDNGFRAPLGHTMVSLKWSAGFGRFVWKIQDERFVAGEWGGEDIDQRTFLIDAQTGELVRAK